MDGETESGPAALWRCRQKSLLTCLSETDSVVRRVGEGDRKESLMWREEAQVPAGDGGGGLGLVSGVTGVGVRTVPLSFKAAKKLVQFAGHACIVEGVGDFGPAVGNLSEPLPDRCGVVG